MDCVKSIQWGRQDEQTAIDYFKNITNLEVTSSGIWLSNSGFLGASPDGLVGEDAIIEVPLYISK